MFFRIVRVTNTMSGDYLGDVFASIPPSVHTLQLALINQSMVVLAKAFVKIPPGITNLDLNHNELYKQPTSALVDAIAAIPKTVSTLNLSANDLDHKSGHQLGRMFAAIPLGITRLELRANALCNKSGADLAGALVRIPPNVTHLDLSANNFHEKHAAELVKVFAAIPDSVQLDSETSNLRKKYNMNCLLDNYLKERTAVTDSTGETKKYFYGSFFSMFQKSFEQKKEAVHALQSALRGEQVDLSDHLATLRNGKLGNELRTFIKLGLGNALVDKNVTTVSDFVRALQEKNAKKPYLAHHEQKEF